MKLEIRKTGINGEGIGYYNRKPVFIDGCYPGETVECELQEKGRYYIGKLNSIITRSNKRVRPVCKYQKDCGGCALMPLKYGTQLKIKKQLVEEALNKYAGISADIGDVIGCSKKINYRNKCNLPFVRDEEGKLVNALYKAGSNKPVIIDECVLHDEKVEKIRKQLLGILNKNRLQTYNHKFRSGLRQLMIRGFDDEYQIALVTGKDKLQQSVIDDIMNISGVVSLYQGFNTQKNPVKIMPDSITLLAGTETINMKLGKYTLKLNPEAFFQLNHEMAEKIYEEVDSLIEKKVGTIVEAFCGIGAIALYLHDKADRIIGIDLETKAIKNARENVWLNEIDNVEFSTEDASKGIARLLNERPVDVLVVDPPRTGLSDDFITSLMKYDIGQIIYVSCNPATLAKNLNYLLEKYDVESIKAFDMFPNTPLVETVCLLYHQKKDYISVSFEPKNIGI